jgi:hypothetical protein
MTQSRAGTGTLWLGGIGCPPRTGRGCSYADRRVATISARYVNAYSPTVYSSSCFVFCSLLGQFDDRIIAVE